MAESRGGRPISASSRPTGGDKAMVGNKRYFRRKKVCFLYTEKIDHIDYKDIELLKRFVTERGKIIPPAHQRRQRPGPAPSAHRHQAGTQHRDAALCERSLGKEHSHHGSNSTRGSG